MPITRTWGLAMPFADRRLFIAQQRRLQLEQQYDSAKSIKTTDHGHEDPGPDREPADTINMDSAGSCYQCDSSPEELSSTSLCAINSSAGAGYDSGVPGGYTSTHSFRSLMGNSTESEPPRGGHAFNSTCPEGCVQGSFSGALDDYQVDEAPY